MAQNRLERQLAAGIRAAQQGNRERARELLEGVLRQDRNNEQAWIWMASVVDTDRERRLSLERVLKINPNNTPAQTALNSMVGVLGGGESNIDYAAISRAARTPAPTPGRSGAGAAAAPASPATGGNNLVPLLAALAFILVLVLVGSFFLPGLLGGQATEEPEIVVAEATEEPSATVDPLFTPPTSTTIPSPTFDGTLVTVTREATLPPTFTPTASSTPTDTPPPTATLPGFTAYDYLVLGEQGSARPALYSVNGDGSGLTPLISNVSDVDYHPETGLIVFTRPILVEQPTLVPTNTPVVTPTIAGTVPPTPVTNNNNQSETGGLGVTVNLSGAELPDILQYEMFISNIDDAGAATEITRSTFRNVYSPSISPDGRSIAVVSDNDGDPEIYIYSLANDSFTQVTDNIGIVDTDPDWSPDGTMLVFASERGSPGRTELYTIEPFADNPADTVERLTDGRGNNTQPQWSPVSNQIVYLNSTNDESGIRLTSTEGRSVANLTFSPNWQFTPPTWSPDGNYVIYSSGAPNDNTLPIQVHVPQARNPNTVAIVNLNIVQVVPR